MTKAEELAYKIASEIEGSPWYIAQEAAAELRRLSKENSSLQARIDALMLEYCPNEMTQEQLDTWAKHQKVHEKQLR